MRNISLLFLISLLIAVPGRCDDIHYDRIPSDVTGYFHIDIDRIVSSPLVQQLGAFTHHPLPYDPFVDNNPLGEHDDPFGEHMDASAYTLKPSDSDESESYVMLFHTGDSIMRQRLEGAVGGDDKHEGTNANQPLQGDSLTITYEKQEIHYTSRSLGQLFERRDGASFPATRPARKPKPAKATEEQVPGTFFSMGLGEGPDIFARKPTFTAFVGKDLIVVAFDLPSMAHALDVIGGRAPSLAQQDPQGIKINAPPGAFVLGAGLTASFAKTNPPAGASSTTRPARASGFNLDMFGTFKGKARLAQFDMGEDDQQLYVDGRFAMNDAQSAGQLKNLISGVKALISLTQADATPLIKPLEVKSDDKNVVLRWSWPTAKLTDLFRLSQALNHHDESSPANAATTQPAD